ncbi:MAG TPA: response regulator transcription factor [Candidatus Paceibacterota bacterium]|nr:response regulator transcription factor [Candidatus Paceibacterota bacterium]
MRVLIIEDDVNIADVVRRGLAAQHYMVDMANDAAAGEDLAWSNDYDVIILDVMLPGMNGKDLCRSLRREGLTTPILMLTALADTSDIVDGLDHGADDYLAKPFDLQVLTARVRALARRQAEQRAAEIRIGDLVIDTANRTVVRGERKIHLTAKVFALLEYLAMNHGRIVTRDAIVEHVWDMNFDSRSNVIESLVHTLRTRIDKDEAVPLIHTIRGVGYLLDANPPG